MPDKFQEVNGISHTARQFEAFATRKQIPFLSIHCGPVTNTSAEGFIMVIQLQRGLARFGSM